MKLESSAVAKLRELVAEEGNPDLMLRVFVQGGGCSGMSYGFTFDEMQNEDDRTIDYKDDIMGSSFVINNPQAQTTCGCGSSFSI
jgi:iron-sulfur cluster insertion protein